MQINTKFTWFIPSYIFIPDTDMYVSLSYLCVKIARESFESGSWIADKNPEHFFEMHKDAWREKWERGGVDLSGDIKLEKLAYSSLYYILSSLPSTDSHRGMNDFGGVSAGGLAQGGASEPTKGEIVKLVTALLSEYKVQSHSSLLNWPLC